MTTPEQVNGNWVAEGTWKPQSAFDIKLAEQAAKQPKKKASSQINDDSGPPVLRRAPGSGSPEPGPSSGNPGSAPSTSGGTSTSSSGSTHPASSNDDPDRPTLKNSSPSSSTGSSRPTLGGDTSQANAQTPPPPSSDDSDRPTLKNSSPSSSTGSSRPTLGGDTSQANAVSADASAADFFFGRKRSRPPSPAAWQASDSAEQQRGHYPCCAKPNAAKTPPANSAAQLRKAPAPISSPQPGHAYPAISDAGVYETRSFLYPMTPAEKEQRGQPMLALAIDEVRKFAGKRAAVATPAKAPGKAAAHPPNFVVTDYDLRAFDLDFSNSPTLVLTAKVPVPWRAGVRPWRVRLLRHRGGAG